MNQFQVQIIISTLSSTKCTIIDAFKVVKCVAVRHLWAIKIDPDTKEIKIIGLKKKEGFFGLN